MEILFALLVTLAAGEVRSEASAMARPAAEPLAVAVFRPVAPTLVAQDGDKKDGDGKEEGKEKKGEKKKNKGDKKDKDDDDKDEKKGKDKDKDDDQEDGRKKN